MAEARVGGRVMETWTLEHEVDDRRGFRRAKLSLYNASGELQNCCEHLVHNLDEMEGPFQCQSICTKVRKPSPSMLPMVEPGARESSPLRGILTAEEHSQQPADNAVERRRRLRSMRSVESHTHDLTDFCRPCVTVDSSCQTRRVDFDLPSAHHSGYPRPSYNVISDERISFYDNMPALRVPFQPPPTISKPMTQVGTSHELPPVPRHRSNRRLSPTTREPMVYSTVAFSDDEQSSKSPTRGRTKAKPEARIAVQQSSRDAGLTCVRTESNATLTEQLPPSRSPTPNTASPSVAPAAAATAAVAATAGSIASAATSNGLSAATSSVLAETATPVAKAVSSSVGDQATKMITKLSPVDNTNTFKDVIQAAQDPAGTMKAVGSSLANLPSKEESRLREQRMRAQSANKDSKKATKKPKRFGSCFSRWRNTSK